MPDSAVKGGAARYSADINGRCGIFGRIGRIPADSGGIGKGGPGYHVAVYLDVEPHDDRATRINRGAIGRREDRRSEAHAVGGTIHGRRSGNIGDLCCERGEVIRNHHVSGRNHADVGDLDGVFQLAVRQRGATTHYCDRFDDGELLSVTYRDNSRLITVGRISVRIRQ